MHFLFHTHPIVYFVPYGVAMMLGVKPRKGLCSGVLIMTSSVFGPRGQAVTWLIGNTGGQSVASVC